MNHTLDYKGRLFQASIPLLLSQFTRFHTHISFHTPQPLCCCTARGAQPARSDYLEHEFHGLLELYLLHRIYLLSAKQGQSHLLRQQLFSHASGSLDTFNCLLQVMQHK